MLTLTRVGPLLFIEMDPQRCDSKVQGGAGGRDAINDFPQIEIGGGFGDAPS